VCLFGWHLGGVLCEIRGRVDVRRILDAKRKVKVKWCCCGDVEVLLVDNCVY